MVNHKLKLVEWVKRTDRVLYQHLVGKLFYLSHTIANVSYIHSTYTYSFMHKPRDDHMEALLRVLQYLKGSPGSGVLL